VGKRYEPLFPYLSDHSTACVVCSDGYVTDDSGTGVVHQAPAFGEDDYRVCLAHGVVAKGEGIPCPVDMNGRFTDAVADFAAQADPNADTAGLQERYGAAAFGHLDVNVANFDGQPELTEMDAIIAYLQVLGTMVDFTTFTPDPTR
jgi:hypothetical protein